jgi:hypothetical protein
MPSPTFRHEQPTLTIRLRQPSQHSNVVRLPDLFLRFPRSHITSSSLLVLHQRGPPTPSPNWRPSTSAQEQQPPLLGPRVCLRTLAGRRWATCMLHTSDMIPRTRRVQLRLSRHHDPHTCPGVIGKEVSISSPLTGHLVSLIPQGLGPTKDPR